MSNSKTADTNLEEKSFIHYFPIVLVGMLICAVPSAILNSCCGIFFPVMAEDFGVPVSQISLWRSVDYITGIVASPFAGIFLAKRNPKVVILAAAVLESLALIGFGAAPELWMIWILGGVAGITNAVMLGVGVAAIMNMWVPLEHRPGNRPLHRLHRFWRNAVQPHCPDAYRCRRMALQLHDAGSCFPGGNDNWCMPLHEEPPRKPRYASLWNGKSKSRKTGRRQRIGNRAFRSPKRCTKVPGFLACYPLRLPDQYRLQHQRLLCKLCGLVQPARCRCCGGHCGSIRHRRRTHRIQQLRQCCR